MNLKRFLQILITLIALVALVALPACDNSTDDDDNDAVTDDDDNDAVDDDDNDDTDDDDTGDDDTTDDDTVDDDTNDDDTTDDDTVDDDTNDDDTTDDDTVDDDTVDDDTVDDDTADDDTTPGEIQRLVIAGDSWSCGYVHPTQEALVDWGYPDVEVSWEFTAVAGSKAEQWANNENNLLDILAVVLDQEPAAELLLISLGGNDFIFSVSDGYGSWWPFFQSLKLDEIVNDLRTIVEFALTDRPHLQVVFLGYDYMHFELMQAYLPVGDDLNMQEFNEHFIELEYRKLQLAGQIDRCEYAHNWGAMQHHFGDTIHPPFFWPPFPYEPGDAPAPGYAPDYNPYPGGIPTFPGPLDHIADGVHPDEAGFRVLIDNACDQGLCNLIEHQPWY